MVGSDVNSTLYVAIRIVAYNGCAEKPARTQRHTAAGQAEGSASHMRCLNMINVASSQR